MIVGARLALCDELGLSESGSSGTGVHFKDYGFDIAISHVLLPSGSTFGLNSPTICPGANMEYLFLSRKAVPVDDLRLKWSSRSKTHFCHVEWCSILLALASLAWRAIGCPSALCLT